MNEEIETIFQNFQVDNSTIPVEFLHYDGKSTTYITYQQIDADGSFSGDDELLGYIDYYDFDVYSKGNFLKVIEKVKEKMKENNYVWQPSRTSSDMYEEDTGYFHKTLCFAKEREV